MDIRILTLFKQHYLDRYPNRLESDYSCWGYYDGMSLKKINFNEQKVYSNLFKSRSRAKTSIIWYETALNVEDIDGGNSQQNIPLFRDLRSSKQDQDILATMFFDEESIMPFFGVAFLQLSESIKYSEVREQIEAQMKWSLKDKCRLDDDGTRIIEEKVNRAICYTTYDNADLVVLIHSNSLSGLERYLQFIENMPEVLYLHSVVGVCECYLNQMKRDVEENRSQEIISLFPSKECEFQSKIHIDEAIERLRIKIATSGSKNLLNHLKSMLDEQNKKYHFVGYSEAWYAYVAGHEDVVIEIRDTNVYTMLMMLIPSGFCTHQNMYYKKGTTQTRIYNIETVYTKKFCSFSSLVPTSFSVENAKDDNRIYLCRKLIDKYKGKMKEQRKRNEDGSGDIDEAIYAYFKAMILTLNSLTQYEEFSLAEDIFYLLYPSIHSFDKQMDIALDKIKEGEEYELRESLKNSICSFLEAINSVIYHTVHTDQIFLMIPGYSGAAFSIPIKLSLLFLWFTVSIADIFKDGENYSCILEPTMEAIPKTEPIDIGEHQYNLRDNHLVRMSISQRSLYMPRALMVISAHEMGHYTGDSLRERELRKENLIKATANYITQLVFPSEDEFKRMFNLKYWQFFRKCESAIYSELKKEYGGIALSNEESEFQLYSNTVERILVAAARSVLLRLGNSILPNTVIFNLVDKIYKSLPDVTEDSFEAISKITRFISERASKFLILREIEAYIEQEIVNYKEIFSDLIPLVVLGCTENEFEESLRVSSGTKFKVEPNQHKVRTAVFHDLCRKDRPPNGKANNIPEDIIVNEECIVNWEYIHNLRLHYADVCRRNLERKTTTPKAEKTICQIHDLFRMLRGDFFTGHASDASGDDIYRFILERINDLKSKINQEIVDSNSPAQ